MWWLPRKAETEKRLFLPWILPDRDGCPRRATRGAAAEQAPCFLSVALNGKTTDPSQRHLSPCSPTLGQHSQGPQHPTPLPEPSPHCREGFCLLHCRCLRPSGYRGVTGFLICLSWHLTLKDESRFSSAGPEGKQRRKWQPRTPWLPGSSWSSGKQTPMGAGRPGGRCEARVQYPSFRLPCP